MKLEIHLVRADDVVSFISHYVQMKPSKAPFCRNA